MSRETTEWLNTYTRIGFEDKRGKAWHYRAGATNHFPGSVPLQEVQDLFALASVVDGEITVTYTDPGTGELITIKDERKKALVNPFMRMPLNYPAVDHVSHDYNEWMADSVSKILDTSKSDLGIASAGLLRNMGQAWLQVEIPDTMTTQSGVQIRPFLTVYTSVDGTLATGAMTGATAVVCDNTLDMARSTATKLIKVKSTKNSMMKIADYRQALDLVVSAGDELSREIDQFVEMTVTDSQWEKFLDTYKDGQFNTMQPDNTIKTGRGFTRAENKRESMNNLWHNDIRVAPWNGTAFGVFQAASTYSQHLSQINGADQDGGRAARNYEKMLNGSVTASDAEIIAAMEKVLVTA